MDNVTGTTMDVTYLRSEISFYASAYFVTFVLRNKIVNKKRKNSDTGNRTRIYPGHTGVCIESGSEKFVRGFFFFDHTGLNSRC